MTKSKDGVSGLFLKKGRKAQKQETKKEKKKGDAEPVEREAGKRAVAFSSIRDLCALLYCENNGRPAIEPEIAFRMLIIEYLYGIKSEARLEEDINHNIAYKWFCGLGLTEKAPDANTISQNRIRHFRDNNIAEQIFNEIPRQCIELRTKRRQH